MELRELRHEDIREVCKLYREAYPGVGFTIEQQVEAFERGLHRTDIKRYVAIDANERIIGGMTLFDFTIYQNYNEIKMCGIGGVYVTLDAKKQGVARFLIAKALEKMKEGRIPVSILYPFRHDFYQQMGWGQVGEIKEFKFAPSSLELYPERVNVRRYHEDDLNGVFQCYESFARSGNCLVKRSEIDWRARMALNPDFFVYEEDGEIRGYIRVSFKKNEGSFLSNDLIIEEMVYNSEKAYFGLLGLVASQFDQFSAVHHFTRRNDPFHHLLKEPRRDSELFNRLYHYSQRVGIGWMFRVVDVEKALLSRLNYNGANLHVTFVIEDSFLPEQNGEYTFTLVDGKPGVDLREKSSCQIKTDIATFSQIFTSYLTLNEAIMLRKAEVNDPTIVSAIDNAFKLPEPMMMEFF